MLAIAFKTLGDKEEAKDIVSDVFLALYERPLLLQSIENINNYLFITVRNHCFQALKKKEKKKQAEGEAHQNSLPGNADEISLHQYLYINEWLKKQFETLQPAAAKILELAFFHGKKDREIAEILKISPQTVATQKSKALRILRTKFRRLPDELIPLVLLIISFNF